MQFFVNSVPVCGDTVPLGVQGENLVTQITADVSGWLAQWPDGQVIVRLIDANRQSHLADTVVNDGTLVWIVTAADTAQGGYGVGVVELVQGDVVKKSEPFATRVVTDPAASGQAPEPVPGWVEETIRRMEELEASATQSAGDAQTSAQSAQAAAAQAAQSAEDAAAVLRQVETEGADQLAAIQAAGQQQTQAVTAAGAQQVSAVQTEGADQRAAIETAGAAQVTAIQAEGQTQQTAIQQKGADTLASIPSDYTELAGDVTELKSQIDQKAPAIWEDASGPIAHIEDGADDMPLRECVVQIEPVQDLHGYDNPWPAGGGKNLADIPTSTIATDGIVYPLTALPKPLPAGDYTVGITSSNSIAWIVVLTDDSNIEVARIASDFSAGGRQTKTGTISSTASKIRIYVNGGTTISNVMLESGSSASPFAPYSNICPITGWTGANVSRTGKNLLKLVESEMISSGWNRAFPISVKEGTYIISCQNDFGAGTTLGVKVDFADDSNTVIKNLTSSYNFGINNYRVGTAATITAEEASKIKRILFNFRAGGASYADIAQGNLQLELGSTASSYEAYQGQSLSITFPTEAGTVYGGSLNVTTGVLTVTKESLVFDSSAWSFLTNFFYKGNTVEVGKNVSGYYTTENGIKMYLNRNNGQARIYLVDNDFLTSESDVGSMLNGYKLLYELSTPISYQLTTQEIRTLLGTNNIWADTGNSSVTYLADTKLYIQQLTKPTEDDLVANAAITSGQFFMIGNRLFIATASIANGAMITPGTNATELSLADALNSLNS